MIGALPVLPETGSTYKRRWGTASLWMRLRDMLMRMTPLNTDSPMQLEEHSKKNLDFASFFHFGKSLWAENE